MNFQTKVLHTENNATYTIINIPSQEDYAQKNNDRQYILLFKLHNKKYICLKLRSGITCGFPGKLLTHHQTCNLPCLPEYDVFIIFGSYGIERLYRHIRTLFERSAVN